MKQKLYMDIRIYDDNMRTIYNQHKIIMDKGIKEANNIMDKKIKGI